MAKVMIHGMGNLGQVVADHLIEKGVEVLPVAYVAPDVKESTVTIKNHTIDLIKDDHDYGCLKELQEQFGPFYIIDCASSRKENKQWIDPMLPNRFLKAAYRNNISFVRGSTQDPVNDEGLHEIECMSKSNCVADKNMAPAIQGLIWKFGDCVRHFPYSITQTVVDTLESHQPSKADPSGTADKLIKGPLYNLGIEPGKFISVRDREQSLRLGVPKNFIDGHGWHIYVISGNTRGIDRLYDELYKFVFNDPKLVYLEYAPVMPKSLERPDMIDGIIPKVDMVGKLLGKKIEYQSQKYVLSDDRQSALGLLYSPGRSLTVMHCINGRSIYGPGFHKGLEHLVSLDQQGITGRRADMPTALGLN